MEAALIGRLIPVSITGKNRRSNVVPRVPHTQLDRAARGVCVTFSVRVAAA